MSASPRQAHRIQLVTTSLMVGGAQAQVVLLARGLKARGHAVQVVSMRAPEAYLADIAAADIPVVSLGMRKGAADPRGVLRLARVIRRWRPDVVHSHMVHANLLARVTRLVAPIPVQISTAHNLSEGARWRDIAYRLTDPLADLTTNVCRACVERFIRVGATPERKIEYMPNGLDTGAFRGDEAERARKRRELAVEAAFVWLAVGRLDVQKDYPTLIRAAAALAGPARRFVVLVAGGGPERAALEGLAADLGVAHQVLRFLGTRADVPSLMEAADGYVLSSAWEGLPMVLLEASAARLPLVATDVGGNAEVVRDGTGGLLVEPSDPDALAAAMRRVMMLDPEERAGWGRVARRHIEETFDIEPIVERWEALYERLLATRRASSTGRER